MAVTRVAEKKRCPNEKTGEVDVLPPLRGQESQEEPTAFLQK